MSIKSVEKSTRSFSLEKNHRLQKIWQLGQQKLKYAYKRHPKWRQIAQSSRYSVSLLKCFRIIEKSLAAAAGVSPIKASNAFQ